MGKVQYIKRSREEYTCGKCRQTIPAGSPYYRGILNFHAPIIRCSNCGLKAYEVTGSEYARELGELVKTWRETHTIENGVWESVAEALQEIYDGVEERYENIPEGLKEGSSGELLQERMDEMQDAIDELDFSFEEILNEAMDQLDEPERDWIMQNSSSDDLEAVWDELVCSEGVAANAESDENDGLGPESLIDFLEHWKRKVEDIIGDRLDEVLGGLSY